MVFDFKATVTGMRCVHKEMLCSLQLWWQTGSPTWQTSLGHSHQVADTYITRFTTYIYIMWIPMYQFNWWKWPTDEANRAIVSNMARQGWTNLLVLDHFHIQFLFAIAPGGTRPGSDWGAWSKRGPRTMVSSQVGSNGWSWKIGSRFCSPKAPPPCQKPAHTCRRTSICPSQESALKLVDTSISQKGSQSGCQILLIKKSKFNHLLSVHPFPLDVRRVVGEAGSRLEGGQIARRTSPPCLSFSIWVIFLHFLIFLHLDHLAPRKHHYKQNLGKSPASRSGIEILVKRYLEGEAENWTENNIFGFWIVTLFSHLTSENTRTKQFESNFCEKGWEGRRRVDGLSNMC